MSEKKGISKTGKSGAERERHTHTNESRDRQAKSETEEDIIANLIRVEYIDGASQGGGGYPT